MRYESLFTPTRSPGLSVVASTSPTTGKNMVCRVVVLSTTHFPFRCASKSMLAPSSSSSSSGWMSSTSTMFETRYGSWLLSLIFSLFSLIFSFKEDCSRARRVDSSFSTRHSFSRRRPRCAMASAENVSNSGGSASSASAPKISLSKSMVGRRLQQSLKEIWLRVRAGSPWAALPWACTCRAVLELLHVTGPVIRAASHAGTAQGLSP
mmetsp:Transcript_12566/g.22224  ORF Transcript_12566/g.22224 Transcript_12566/m.22224 type:complete len:208 (+) Transcript_12566:1775-2398(+)